MYFAPTLNINEKKANFEHIGEITYCWAHVGTRVMGTYCIDVYTFFLIA